MDNKKRQNKVKPTKKQSEAFRLLKSDPSLSMGEAMRKAGYSEKSLLNPGRVLLKSRGSEQIEADWKETLNRHGIYMETLAVKYSEFLNAKRFMGTKNKQIVFPDFDIQLKTVEILKHDLGLGSKKNQEERSVTFVWKKPAN